MVRRVIFLAPFVIGLASCQQDTNVITPETVQASNQHRIEVIDKDPNLTPEQKQARKQALRLVPGGPPRSQGPGAAQGRGR